VTGIPNRSLSCDHFAKLLCVVFRDTLPPSEVR
jgi:hypothetical protein